MTHGRDVRRSGGLDHDAARGRPEHDILAQSGLHEERTGKTYTLGVADPYNPRLQWKPSVPTW